MQILNKKKGFEVGRYISVIPAVKVQLTFLSSRDEVIIQTNYSSGMDSRWDTHNNLIKPLNSYTSLDWQLSVPPQTPSFILSHVFNKT